MINSGMHDLGGISQLAYGAESRIDGSHGIEAKEAIISLAIMTAQEFNTESAVDMAKTMILTPKSPFNPG